MGRMRIWAALTLATLALGALTALTTTAGAQERHKGTHQANKQRLKLKTARVQALRDAQRRDDGDIAPAESDPALEGAVDAMSDPGHQHGGAVGHLLPTRKNVKLVSKLSPTDQFGDIVEGQIADLAVFKGYAYLNSWSEPTCTRGGTYVLASQAAGRLADHGEALRHVGPSFRDMTRVAGANTEIWTDIYRANRSAIAEEISAFRRELERVEELLAEGDVAAWNEQAREDRRALLESDVAGAPVHELRLTVPNRPGIVAQVALGLGKAGVNIVDLALAPASDMRSGAMTLWIAGDAQAARAAELIGELGFPVAEQ